jgi:hypothetical protein
MHFILKTIIFYALSICTSAEEILNNRLNSLPQTITNIQSIGNTSHGIS